MRETPYWWDSAPPLSIPFAPPPARADVVVLGSGYTGLAAARRLAFSGARVVVLEKETLGWGASSRNGGQVLTGWKLGASRLLRRFGRERGKIAAVVESWDGRIRTGGGRKESDLSPLELALRMKSIGVSRLLYSSVESATKEKRLDLEGLRHIAQRSLLRVTAQGGVRNYRDLIALQELSSAGVDSVIIGRPLYENSFPCQRLWRINEQHLKDLGPTRRM